MFVPPGVATCGMPWFRFTGDVKFELHYRNCSVVFTIAVLDCEPAWAWVARKVDGTVRPAEVILWRDGNMLALRRRLSIDGFPVDRGTPAAKIMLTSCRCGYSEQLPDDPTTRAALFASRRVGHVFVPSSRRSSRYH